jgi:hypothetical protein
MIPDVPVKITIGCYMYFYLLFHPIIIFTTTSKSEHFEVCVTLLFFKNALFSLRFENIDFSSFLNHNFFPFLTYTQTI